MKVSTIALLLLLASAQITAGERGASELKVRTSSGRTVAFNEAKDLAVKFWLQQLVLSALYRDVVQESSAGEWGQAQQAANSVYCQYPFNSQLALPERQALTFDEILLPVPPEGAPSYAYLKHGSKYLRVAKFDPWVFERLKIEAELSSAKEPKAQRGLF